MKKTEIKNKLLLTIGIILISGMIMQAQHERIYFGVEIDGVLCGYATTDIDKAEYQGMPVLETHDTVHLMMKALGQDMNMSITTRHILDPETYKVYLNNSNYSNSDVGNIASTRTEIFKEYALHTEAARETADTIWMQDEFIFDNPITSPYLIKDFIEDGAKEKTYHVYDYMRGFIAEQKFTLEGEKDIQLAGQNIHALVFNVYHTKDGTNTRLWLNKENGMTVQFEIMNRRIFLAENTISKHISTVDLDNTIFAKVEKSIPNFMEVSYMRIQADIKSAGEAISVESLNFQGQKFEGTVDENHIQGIFEIEPFWYDGTDAPAFPTDYSGEESLVKYLEPELFIESDDPEIISMAKDITSGADDSWKAAVLLSEWVGKEIHGAVPGGTSAINTLRIREGECGSHSRLLAAFCRAVGIPSRLAVGCLYSPWYGGSFGQHAWTEVYMGAEIGWIAVDATILEFDYVDAGHIRLGELTSFHPEKMEILEYRIEGADASSSEIPEEYLPILGPYMHPDKRDVLNVFYLEGCVTVDIAGKMKLALNEPDEEGRMYAKLTDKVYFSFPEDKMHVVETVFAMKRADVEISIDEGTPENLQALIGPYMIFQIQKEFTVIWKDGLAMIVPDVEEPRMLEKTEKENRWKDTIDKKEYIFKVNDDGSVSGMDIYITAELNKGATAAWIIDNTIEEEGLEAAADKFTELWNNRALDLEKTEDDLNDLGHKYLGAERFEEALMVFKLNVNAYPQSWNVYDSYGEALMKNGETEKAIENYQKAVEMNPENENGKRMLEKLRSIE